MSKPCPGCAAPVFENPRYPNRFCEPCTELTEDESGGRLLFRNASSSGGLSVARADAPGQWSAEVSEVHCQIRGIAAVVREARFGGIVACAR